MIVNKNGQRNVPGLMITPAFDSNGNNGGSAGSEEEIMGPDEV